MSWRRGFNLIEVVSFTALANLHSQAVKHKIGMVNSGDNFMHPDIDVTPPLCEHVLYKVSRLAWEKRHVPETSGDGFG